MMKKYFGVSVSLFLVLLVWACSSDTDEGVDPPPTAPTFNRVTLLTNWADNIIIPSYQSFTDTFATFETSFQIFSQERTQGNFDAVRSAWEAAYRSWQHVSMFEIGPAEQNGLRLNVNTFPADVLLIEDQIAGGTYDFTLSSTRDSKGFAALDYLFNGPEDALASFTNATTGDGRITYTSDVILDIGTRVNEVLAAWESQFRDSFIASDGSSSTSSVDRMTNDYIFYFERFLRAGKMGIPAGVFTGEVAPNTLEAFYQEGLGNALFQEGLDAVQDFFNGVRFNGGANDVGFDDYLRTITGGDELAQSINNQMNMARTEVNALDSFLSEIENNDPPVAMLEAYGEVQRLVPLIKTDMFSLLSIDVDFVDADGD